MAAAIPKIACLAKGPYYLLNDGTPRVIPNIQKADGTPCLTVTGVALCRCGASNNKPFCDGSHGKIGFADSNNSASVADVRRDYKGKQVTIHDNRAICSHAGICTDNLSAVFKLRTEPWIEPDAASTQEIIDTIKKCPSGALSYSLDNVEHRDQDRAPMITVTKDGPYAVTGGIQLVDQARAIGASLEHYTLCRCGASNNKPFCDGSHWRIGFKDSEGG